MKEFDSPDMNQLLTKRCMVMTELMMMKRYKMEGKLPLLYQSFKIQNVTGLQNQNLWPPGYLQLMNFFSFFLIFF